MSDFHEVMPGIAVSTSREMLTNSVILSSQNGAFLVDPAWMPDELEAIADYLERKSLTVIGGFATHAHHDHLLWHPRFGEAPRWASSRTAELARINRSVLLRSLGEDFPAPLAELMGKVRVAPDVFPGECVPSGFTIEQVVHDGHVPGHTALWLPEQRVLIAGDMLSDVEIPLPFHPGGLTDYVQALDLLAPWARRAKVIIPGHGYIGSDGGQRLEADRAYINGVLRQDRSDDPRIKNPGMAIMHKRMQQQARETVR